MGETLVNIENGIENLQNYAVFETRNVANSIPDVLPRNYNQIQKDSYKVNCPDLLRNADLFPMHTKSKCVTIELKVFNNTERNLSADMVRNNRQSNYTNGNSDLHEWKSKDTLGTDDNFGKMGYFGSVLDVRGHFVNEGHGEQNANVKVPEAALSDGTEYVTLDILLHSFSKKKANDNDSVLSTVNQYLNAPRPAKYELISKDSKKRKEDSNKKEYASKEAENDKIPSSNTLSRKISKCETVYSKLRKLSPARKSQSFEDRPLSPIGVDYKLSNFKSEKPNFQKCQNLNSRLYRNLRKSSTTQRISQKNSDKETEKKCQNISELSEMFENEFLLCENKYSKIPNWAKQSIMVVKDSGSKKLSALPLSASNLDILIDSRSTEEHERKRRLDRDEIRRRLAVETDEEASNSIAFSCQRNNFQTNEDKECDFFTKQTRLQIEARLALSQAKDLARLQMNVDRQKQCLSPITGMIRSALQKAGIQISSQKRRISRQMLTDMSIVQLQIIVNDLHNHIECFNALLVHYLTERDDLHLDQDSKLADIENLTRYLCYEE